MWDVPDAFVARMGADPTRATWCSKLPHVAAGLAGRWRLRPDGPAWSGFMSTIWPVRMAAGDRGALKISWLDAGSRAEPIALRAWAGRRAVVLVEHDESSGAMVLQRLDGDRTLETHPDIDEACTIIGTILASLGSVAAPEGVPPLEVEAQRIADSIAANRFPHPGTLPDAAVDQALATLHGQVQELVGRKERVLVHGDLHFLNVLHTLRGQPAGWVAIDPLPSAGIREWDVTALLRNRWKDAIGSGNADAALRRRVDLVSEITGMDPSLVRAIAQAIAVDNLLWLLPRDPDQMFVAPYTLMSSWRD